MAMPATLRRFTPEEYLTIERQSEFKSELVDGQMYAMTGATRKHNVVAFNIGRKLGNQLEDRPCDVYASDMRVRIPGKDSYYYPDVIVACGEQIFEDGEEDTLVNPVVVFEVRSRTTAMYDRTTKFANYIRIPSLTDVLLVAQDEPHIEHFTRVEDDWVLRVVSGLDGTVDLPAIGCTLPMAEIYRRVL